jgi:non-ribosomal peptide synthase protein (TIGR01720 family)
MDGVSWRVILADLVAADARLRRGEPARLPAPPVSWRRWAERLAAAATKPEILAELPLWEEVVRAGAPPLPVDLPGAPEQNTAGTADQVVVELEEETTRALLQRMPETHHARIEEALLSSLVRALAPWIGESVLVLDLEGHGRQGDEVDLSRTVGWFTAIAPVRIDLRGAGSPGAALRAVKETLRGPVQRGPSQGLGYGLLRWLGGADIATRLTPAVPPGLLFNYLGQLDATFGAGGIDLAPEPMGPVHAPAGRRSHLLEINAYVLGGRLGMTWAFSPAFHHRATIVRLAGAYQEALRELAASPEEAVLTPSDFPGAELDQAGLDHLLARLE